MTINLSRPGVHQGVFFSPEEQEKVFQLGINGIDITNGIPKRQPDYQAMEELQTLRNVYKMVQDGELVPKQVMYIPPQRQESYPQPQQAPVVQNEQSVRVPIQEPDREIDWMEQLGLRQKQVEEVQVPQQQQQQPSQVQNESPRQQINWEQAIMDQQNKLVAEAAKNGVRGDEVLQWMGQLEPADYVELFKSMKTATMQSQEQPVVRQQNPNYFNSIGDLPNSASTVARPDPQWSAFGIDPNRGF